MKKISLLLIGLFVVLSCSSDDSSDNDSENNMEGTSNLVGTWNMTDVRFAQNLLDPTLILADEIVDFLVAENCFLASFTFNNDGTVTSSNSVNYIVPDASPTGLSVDCPMESDTDSGTWSLEGNQLTLTDENEESETLTIQFEGNDTLIISGDDINEGNFSGAEAVFTRQ